MGSIKLKAFIGIISITFLITFISFQFFESWTIRLEVARVDEAPLSVKMSRRDKKRLEYFFKQAILHNDYGYTLLGRKPISLSAYQNFSFSSDLIGIYSALLSTNIKMKLGWKAWEKYRHHFNLKHFVLWEEESPWIKNGSIILLANRESFEKTYRKYEQDFQASGSNVDLNKVSQEPLLVKQLNGHEGLIGTLLGYGRGNGWLFYSSSEQERAELSSLWEEKIDKMLRKQFQGTTLDEQLGYPQFIADVDSAETKLLKDDYKKTRKLILQTYEGKDFLETTLSLLNM